MTLQYDSDPDVERAFEKKSIPDEEYEKSLLFDAALESEPHYVVVRLIKTYVLSVLVDLDECGLDPDDDDEIIRTARDIAATDVNFGNNVDVIDVQTDFAEIEED